LYFTVGAIALIPQNNARNQTVVNLGPPAGVIAPALTTGDMDFDWRVEPSFLLGYRPTKMDAWEISYFGLDDWNTERTAPGPSGAVFSLPGDLGSGLFTDLGAPFSSVAVNYSSRIDNAEINYFWHHDCPALMWMAGFRYFHLDERFDILGTIPGTPDSSYDIHTDNDLFGGQLGVRLQHCCCSRFEFDVTAKAGAYGNSVGQSQSVDEAGTLVRDNGRHEADWAFIGDIGTNCSYYICKNWCAMIGYNAMWVDGVALAPDQLDFSAPLVPGAGGGLNRGGNVFYQGGHVALGCKW
jgi:hypothetical protein